MLIEERYLPVMRRAFEDELEKISFELEKTGSKTQAIVQAPGRIRRGWNTIKGVLGLGDEAAGAASKTTRSATSAIEGLSNQQVNKMISGNVPRLGGSTKAVVEAAPKVVDKTTKAVGASPESVWGASGKKVGDWLRGARDWAVGKSGFTEGVKPLSDLSSWGKAGRVAKHMWQGATLPARAGFQAFTAPYNYLRSQVRGLSNLLPEATQGASWGSLTGGQKMRRVTDLVMSKPEVPFKSLSTGGKAVRSLSNVAHAPMAFASMFWIDEPVVKWARDNIPGANKVAKGIKNADFMQLLADTSKGGFQDKHGLLGTKTGTGLALLGALSPSTWPSTAGEHGEGGGDPRTPIAATNAQKGRFITAIDNYNEAHGTAGWADNPLMRYITADSKMGKQLVKGMQQLSQGGRPAPALASDVKTTWEDTPEGTKKTYSLSPTIRSGSDKLRASAFTAHRSGEKSAALNKLFSDRGIDTASIGAIQNIDMGEHAMALPVTSDFAASWNTTVEAKHRKGQLVGVEYNKKGMPIGISLDNDQLAALGYRTQDTGKALRHLNTYIDQPTVTGIAGSDTPFTGAGLVGYRPGYKGKEQSYAHIVGGETSSPPFTPKKWGEIQDQLSAAQDKFKGGGSRREMAEARQKVGVDIGVGTFAFIADYYNRDPKMGAVIAKSYGLNPGEHFTLTEQEEGGAKIELNEAGADHILGVGNKAAGMLMMRGRSKREVTPTPYTGPPVDSAYQRKTKKRSFSPVLQKSIGLGGAL